MYCISCNNLILGYAAGAYGGISGGAILGGFTAKGVAGASVAAAWQSSIGNVVAGSLFAKATQFGQIMLTHVYCKTTISNTF